MDRWMLVISALAKIIILYSTLLSLLCLLPRRKYPRRGAKTRFAILIAARNEEGVIGEAIRDLRRQNYPQELFDIFVLPNNCTDHTEAAARQAGARILPCPGPVRCKGDALHYGFEALMALDFDAFCVFDADNRVDPAFLSRMNDALLAGARAAKGKQVSLNPGDSWVAGGYDIYRESMDLTVSRAKTNLGLSAKLMGTGFAVTRELMKELGGWNTETITEDTEFAAQLADRGVQIAWVPEALSYDEEPVTLSQSLIQRLRWVGGVQAVGRKWIPRLFRRARQDRRLLALDFAMFLLLPYAQLLALLPALWNLAGTVTGPGWLDGTLLSLALYWLGTTVLGAGLCILGRRDLKAARKGILLYPLFTATWLPLQVIAFFRRSTDWKPIVRRVKKAALLPEIRSA